MNESDETRGRFEESWRLWRLTAGPVAIGVVVPILTNVFGSFADHWRFSTGFGEFMTVVAGIGWLFAAALPFTLILNIVAAFRVRAAIPDRMLDRREDRRMVFMWGFLLVAFVLAAALLIGTFLAFRQA